MKRCYEDHPQLPIVVGDKTYVITGGSCTSGNTKGHDVFVGLDHGMKMTARQFPWEEGVEIFYPITDMGVPENLPNFKKLIEYLSDSLRAGLKVYVGCIGGHGRTGLVFSALVAHMTKMKDATTYVRKNYCERAVESTKQVDWLAKHFGVKKVKPAKTGDWSKGTGRSDTYYDNLHAKWPGKGNGNVTSLRGDVVKPMTCTWNIHGDNKTTTV